MEERGETCPTAVGIRRVMCEKEEEKWQKGDKLILFETSPSLVKKIMLILPFFGDRGFCLALMNEN